MSEEHNYIWALGDHCGGVINIQQIAQTLGLRIYVWCVFLVAIKS